MAAYYLEEVQKAQRVWRELEAQYPPAAYNLRLLAAPGQATCLPAESGPAGADPRGEHVEELAVGMYADDLSAEWGQPQARRVDFSPEVFTLARYPNAVETVAQDRIVHMIQVQPSYRGATALGIRIGDHEDTIRARYGPPTRILPMRNGQSWGYDVSGIAFQLRQAKVVSWLIYD